jgi:2-polyprenyl-3-methyl-5-hydroxy-6-metoxy-1,4-benzoquinol methylase
MAWKKNSCGVSPRRYEFSTKPSCLGAEVVLSEVRKRSMFEAKRDATTLDGLLTYANGHLRDVDEGTLRTSDNHLFDVVVILQVSVHVDRNRLGLC